MLPRKQIAIIGILVSVISIGLYFGYGYDYRFYGISTRAVELQYSLYVVETAAGLSAMYWAYRRSKTTEITEGRIYRGLRLTFGFLWLFDSLLQLLPQMSTGFGNLVLGLTYFNARWPATPLLAFSIHTWNQHPVLYNAAGAALETIIGIGILALPRKKLLYRFILIISLLWSGYIWIFGEGLGGFPAYYIISEFSGVPGSVTVYMFVSFLLLRRNKGDDSTLKIVAAYMIAFNLLGAILQAIPAYGFWGPYNLSRMVYDQGIPGLSAIFYKAPVIWNVQIILVMIFIAVAWYFRPKIAGLLSAAWFFFIWDAGQDFGFVSGSSTDANTGLPLIAISLVISWAVGNWSQTARLRETEKYAAEGQNT